MVRNERHDVIEERGWDHFGSPLNIQKLDVSDRFKTDEEAQEAHRKECGCLWPERDYQDDMLSWFRYLEPEPGKVRELFEDLTELGLSRPNFIENLPRMMELCARGIDLAPPSIKAAFEGAMLILKEVSKKQKDGTLNKYQFSFAQDWFNCFICRKIIPPDGKIFGYRGIEYHRSNLDVFGELRDLISKLTVCEECIKTKPEEVRIYERIKIISDKERVRLISKWSSRFYDLTETFKGEIGMQLAYLWPAIAKGERIEVDPSSELVLLLKRENIKDDEIWDFIDEVPEDEL